MRAHAASDRMNALQDKTVVLLSGLWTPAWVMRYHQRHLTRAGFRCVRFRYASARASLEENSERLAAFVRSLDAGEVYLVGHSLGGIIALHAAASHGLARVRRVLLVGSPYGDSHAARSLARWRIGRWMLGKTVPQWLQCEKPSAPPGVEVGVVAGTMPIGLGMLVAPDLPRPHDGVVCVAETRVPGMAAYVECRVNHIGMVWSRRIAELIAEFLAHGRFEPAGQTAQAAADRGYALDSRRES